eukprot:6212353-Pleurochrysis_carterae.AAC.2
MSAEEALAISFDLGIAALVGEKLYNFGELLEHPVRLRVRVCAPFLLSRTRTPSHDCARAKPPLRVCTPLPPLSRVRTLSLVDALVLTLARSLALEKALSRLRALARARTRSL